MQTFTSVLLGILISNLSFAKSIDGFLSVWQRPPCLPTKNCELPKALGAPQFFSFQTPAIENLKPGTHPATPVELKVNEFSVRLEVYTVVKTDLSKSYLVTQEYLSDSKNILISQCSQYHNIEDVDFFPVGSCSGLSNNMQVGMSFIKPEPSDK